MSELRANTDIMRDGSSVINNAASEAGGIAGRVSSLAAGIGGEFHGQLRDKVQPILGSLESFGAQLQNRSEELGTALSEKASEIDAVMQSTGMNAASVSYVSSSSQVTNFFNGLRQLALGSATAILGWIGLGHIKNTAITTQTRQTTQVSELVPPTSKPLTSSPYYEYGQEYKDGPYKGLPHPGIDVSGKEVDEIHPIGAGTVVRIRYDKDGYGNYVVVKHDLANGNSIYSVYAQ